ncbi:MULTISPECIES: restriction endonuclease subunit S [Enterococcus]|uniref:Type I restriction modification DNA specificity domain protein n=3 Tax=Enterococcus faecalis TaxID=1351 RepID=A0ABC9P7H4_ENTFL|nr:restriction endonuclease subunit S [Enterococcus faecalis]EEU86587.1 type I restriction-modification system specificity subunit [Enterococcus faecalis CH188]EFQ14621.1 type I restriction modification DNA specificity domain protein [Enterococcus faecalis EnGen0311]EFU06510.1 type I restriction modification DNA specificity domain protein [Enterococcus faecalis TX0645]EFU90784.1 type I restriction modification DNA specificity domain protein [Enterococcus faecalis TX0630]EGO5192310.1 restrictio
MIVFTLIGVWEQCKLGDLGSVAMNKRIFKEQTSESGDIPFYKIGTFGATADAFISRELFETYKKKYPYPKIGDLLISASGSIGRVVEYKGNDEYFQDSNIVWLKHDDRINNLFLKQFYSIVKWHGLEGSTIKRLYNKNILETTIHLPVFDEQEKIGTLFKQLDDIITLHQRKLEQLKELKKAYLQAMFVPTNVQNNKVPKLRFANFEGNWELCKLENVIDKQIKGKVKVENLCNGSVEYLDANRLNGGKPIYTKALPDVSERDIIILWDGSKAGKVYYGFKGVLGSTLKAYQLKECANSQFIYQQLLDNQNNIYNNYRTPNIPHVVKNFSSIFPIWMTSFEEQSQMADILSNLDNRIILQQNLTDTMISLKKSYLQNMFI